MSGSSAAIERPEIHSEGQHVLIHARLCVCVPARGWEMMHLFGVSSKWLFSYFPLGETNDEVEKQCEL